MLRPSEHGAAGERAAAVRTRSECIMTDREKAKGLIFQLREAIDDIRRHRNPDFPLTVRDEKLLIEYALLRALTAVLDLGKIWALAEWQSEIRRSRAAGEFRNYSDYRAQYGDGLPAMRSAGVELSDWVAEHFGNWAAVRNRLAHQSDGPLEEELVFSLADEVDHLEAYRTAIEQFLEAGHEGLYPGAIINGEIVDVAEFGAFVDLGRLRRGLIHRSEMCEGRLDNPSKVVNVGERVDVLVLSIEAAGSRVSLRLQPLRALPDPDETERRGPRSATVQVVRNPTNE